MVDESARNDLASMKVYHRIFLCIVSVFIFSCGILNKRGKTTETPSVQNNQLINTKWFLNDSAINVYLTFSQGSFSGFGGCNTIGGEYRRNGFNIEFYHIISTKKYCESISSNEFSFLNLLKQVNRYQIRGNTFYLFRDKILLLKFQSQ